MSKGFDLPSNKHLGNSHDYWLAPQKNSKRLTEKGIVMTEKQVSNFNFASVPQIWDDFKCWFIFSDDGRISCRLSIYNEQPQEAIVSDLYTHENIRKHGGAKAILNFCFDFARDRKCNTISLRSDNDDWVRLWYQRMGFEVESSSLWFTKKI